MKKLLLKLVILYQKCISPILPPSCRYYPTCSNYMIQALNKHGSFLGLLMGIARILRCHPFTRGGYDPVPDYFSLKRNDDWREDPTQNYVLKLLNSEVSDSVKERKKH